MSEDRWNRGWLGRGRARDCLPDRERPWPVPIVPMVLCRLSVEGGAGMPDVRLTPWRVYRESRVNIVHGRVGWGEVSTEETRRKESHGGKSHLPWPSNTPKACVAVLRHDGKGLVNVRLPFAVLVAWFP
nr:hypothetical protein B23L21.80 [imported] - Neurospora crassa [Neurospora crassa]